MEITKNYHPPKKWPCYFMIGLMFFLFGKTIYPQTSSQVVIGEKGKIYSHVLEKEIQLSMHIPDDYKNSKERYPVLYIFQTHFEQVSGAVKNLYDYRLIPKIIVIGIDNYEFGYLTPTKIESNPNSGKADKFLQFFKEELFPYIDLNYRTYPFRIVFSNSWGAMFATYAILAKPDVFNAAAASIPWLPYDEEEKFIIKNTEGFLVKNQYNNFLYMTMDNESIILPDLETFINILKKYPRPGLEWQYHYWPEEDHTSTPYRSIYAGLRYFFKDWNSIPLEIAYKGLDHIKKHEVQLKAKFGYDIGISTTALRKAGQELQDDKKYNEAIAIFRYALEKSPNDAFAYVTLGRAYEANNQLNLAKEAYEEGYRIAVSASHPQVKWIKNFVIRINQKIKK